MYCARRAEPSTAAGRARSGVLYGSMLCFMSVSAAAVTFPFAQTRRDALGCDALCQGGQTSLRSLLTLLGAALIGRASDRFGRIPMMWVGMAGSLMSYALNIGMDSLDGMWYAIVPAALLNQNFSVAKALISDYLDEIETEIETSDGAKGAEGSKGATGGSADADRAGAVGKLGMAVGFSFMFGPMLATQLVSR